MPAPVIRSTGIISTSSVSPASLGALVEVISGLPIREWRWRIDTTPMRDQDSGGMNGDFTNGVAAGDNPAFNCFLTGRYTFLVNARNNDGWCAPVLVQLQALEGTINESGDAGQALLEARAAQTSANTAQATANTGVAAAAAAQLNATQALTTTGRPVLGYNSVTLVTATLPRGQSSCRRTLQDGKSRSFAVAPTFNPALGAVEGGLDVGVEAPSTWYYLYLVPTAANDALLCVRGSASNPSVGPSGYTNFEYIGAVYNDAGGDLIDFHHEGGPQFKYDALRLIYDSGGAVGPDGATVDTNLAAFVPWTATSVLLYGDLEGPGGGTVYEWRYSMYAAGALGVHLEVRGSSTICILEWDQGIETPQHVWRQLVRTSGGANVVSASLFTNGWDDGWLV